MDKIIELNDTKIIVNILNRAFLSFANEYNFTKENAPNHLAFINSERVDAFLDNGLKMYGYETNGKVVGCAGYSFYKENVYLIERLAILPEYQSKGFGKSIMGFIENKIKNIGGKIIEIHVTDKNIPSREWYKKQGYVEIRIQEVNIPGIVVVPFKACVMNKKL